MSYVSLLKNIPEFLSQPTGIAVIASLGIHGAIAFLLPLAPVDSKPKQQVASAKPVGLVELNQAEQKRLPQASTPQVSLQPVPLQPQVPPLPNFANQQATLPPLPPASSTQLILPPLPKSSTNLSIASLPKGQSLGVLPKRDLQINPINSPNLRTAAVQPSARFNEDVKLGESKPLPPSNMPELQAATTPVNLPPNYMAASPPVPVPALPPSNMQALQARMPAEMSRSNLPALQAATMPANLPGTPSPILSDTTATATAYRNTTPTTEAGSGTPKIAENQQLIAPIAETPQTRDRLALAGSNLLRSPLQSTPNIPGLLSTPRESGIAKTTTFGEQFNQVKQQYPNLETKVPIAETINTNAGREGKVEGGLVVDAEGKVESVNFLNNSVSSDLRTAAREHLREYFQKNPTQANGKPKYYPFSLSFRSNSSPEVLNHTSASSLTNQKQASSELRQRLIQLRSSSMGTQPSQVSHSSSSAPVKILPQHPVRNNLPVLVPAAVKPFPELQARNNQVTSTPLATTKPLSEQLPRNNQAAPAPQVATKPAPEPFVSSNQPSSSVESGQKLLRRLRKLREQRQNSHQE